MFILLCVLWTIPFAVMLSDPVRSLYVIPLAILVSVWIHLMKQVYENNFAAYAAPFVLALGLLPFGRYELLAGCVVPPFFRFFHEEVLGGDVKSYELLVPVFVSVYAVVRGLGYGNGIALLSAGLFSAAIPTVYFLLKGRSDAGERTNDEFDAVSDNEEASVSDTEANPETTTGLESQKSTPPTAEDPRKIIKQLKKKAASGKVSFDELSIIWNAVPAAEDREGHEAQILVGEKKEEDNCGNISAPTEEVSPPAHTEPARNKSESNGALDENSGLLFNDGHVRRIYEEFVRPLDIRKFGVYRRVSLRLLKLLDEVASVPSVTDEKEDRDGIPENSFELLKRISLAEHTRNVVRKAREITEEVFGDTYIIVWPTILLAAVAHDLGKARKFRNEVTSYYGGHARISAEIFSLHSEDLPREQRKTVFEIILHHHGEPKTLSEETKRFLAILKEADAAARNAEWKELSDDLPDRNEITPGDFLGELFRLMESEMERGSVKRYSFVLDEHSGLLYVSPRLVTEALRRAAQKKKVFWPDLFSSDDSAVARAVSSFLEEKITDLLPAGFYKGLASGRMFMLKHVFLDGKPSGRKPFVPFIISALPEFVEVDPERLVDAIRNSAFYRLEVSS